MLMFTVGRPFFTDFQQRFLSSVDFYTQTLNKNDFFSLSILPRIYKDRNLFFLFEILRHPTKKNSINLFLKKYLKNF